MNATVRLLDRWMRHKGFKTDAEAARELGTNRATLNHWRKRGSHASADFIVRMCEDLNENLAVCLRRIANEQKAGRHGGASPTTTKRLHDSGGRSIH